MNRAIARRTMFESKRDFRKFLSLVAKEVRAGRLEVHSYCLMLTHFHMLVRSPNGQLSKAMENIQREYSRWFNRTRRRDGTLVRGRFRSKPVRDIAYRCNVLSYIHDNPVHAGNVAKAGDYYASSARHWAERGTRKMPKWLATDWIESELDARGATELEEVFPSRLEPEVRDWIEKQIERRIPEEDEDTTIRHVLSPRTVRWAIRKARLADGTRPFRPVSPARLVEQAVLKWMKRVGPLLGLLKNQARDAWTNLRAGLLRALSGCTQREIGLRIRRHNSTVCRDLQTHRGLLAHVPDYEQLHATIANDVLETMRTTARVAAR
jgi:REP element-mobilizing transposase RayT